MTSSFRVQAFVLAVALAATGHLACKSQTASDGGEGGEAGGAEDSGGGGGGSEEGGRPGGKGGAGTMASGGAGTMASGGAGDGGGSGGAGVGGGGGALLGTGGTGSSARTLLPPPGKTLLIVGQDVQTVLDYAKDVSANPGGITTYTSISESSQAGPRLEGLTSTANQGGGDLNAAQMAARFPNSVLSIGLYIVDHTGSNLDHIADGTHDASIDQLGAFIASVQRPVFLRIGYEFDGTWNHYEPEKYKAAFRRIALRLRPAHPNVAFVWQSATYAEGRYRNLPLASWYPGDDVVDWFGSSYFKYAAAPHAAMLEMARQRNKPLLIAEASPQGYDLARLRFSDTGANFANRTAEQVWQGWFEPFFRFIDANQDVIRAVAYINAHWDAQAMWAPQAGNGYWGDARVQANALILERWRNETAKARWLHAGPTLFQSLTAARP